ncbi:MAG: hypothetical protein R3346_01140 [Candidatus Spechtbacterales bacterium]|nr:hypothetical protein [Candidatus Spechtbacterales bacterium]
MDQLTLPIIVGAALADSINPCVFGVLIFLLGFMMTIFKSKKRMLLGGLWYTFIVYLTYLGIGFGILRFLQNVISTEFSQAFYWIAAIIAIIAGLLEIKDYFWYGKGVSLQMIPGGAERIKMYTKKLQTMQDKHPKLTFLLIGLLGVFVVLVELPCTGAPYFAVLNLLAQGDYLTAVPYLLLYNFVFIIPLFFIIGVAYFSQSSDALERWRKEHRGTMRLGIGLFLIVLGAYMIYSVGAF